MFSPAVLITDLSVSSISLLSGGIQQIKADRNKPMQPILVKFFIEQEVENQNVSCITKNLVICFKHGDLSVIRE